MPAVLTVRTEDDGVDSYGSTCPEHPQHDRQGLVQHHAINVVAKHNREDHAEPVLNLSAAARAVVEQRDRGALGVRGPAATAVWQALTGLGDASGELYLRAVLEEPEDVLVHVAPF